MMNSNMISRKHLIIFLFICIALFLLCLSIVMTSEDDLLTHIMSEVNRNGTCTFSTDSGDVKIQSKKGKIENDFLFLYGSYEPSQKSDVIIYINGRPYQSGEHASIHMLDQTTLEITITERTSVNDDSSISIKQFKLSRTDNIFDKLWKKVCSILP